ncbi:MAG: hypothetical protein ACLPND_09465 [Candidatus Korobacteraceae bacterium]|jgi:hypothetical protein
MLYYFQQRVEAIFRNMNFVIRQPENLREYPSAYGVVIHYQNVLGQR